MRKSTALLLPMYFADVYGSFSVVFTVDLRLYSLDVLFPQQSFIITQGHLIHTSTMSFWWVKTHSLVGTLLCIVIHHPRNLYSHHWTVTAWYNVSIIIKSLNLSVAKFQDQNIVAIYSPWLTKRLYIAAIMDVIK